MQTCWMKLIIMRNHYDFTNSIFSIFPKLNNVISDGRYIPIIVVSNVFML